MEKNRGTVIAVIAALVVSVISLGVAFATFSRSLTINGNATVQASTWDVHYSVESNGVAASGNTIANSESTKPAQASSSTLNAYTFDFTATFREPGEKVKYEFYIVNAGTYAATLSQAVSATTPTCKTLQGAALTCPTGAIHYSITKDGTNPFGANDSVAAGASQLVTVEASLDSDYGMDGNGGYGSEGFTVTFPTVTFNYNQGAFSSGS